MGGTRKKKRTKKTMTLENFKKLKKGTTITYNMIEDTSNVSPRTYIFDKIKNTNGKPRLHFTDNPRRPYLENMINIKISSLPATVQAPVQATSNTPLATAPARAAATSRTAASSLALAPASSLATIQATGQATSKKRQATSKKRQATSKKRQATIQATGQATSKKRQATGQATSKKRQATGQLEDTKYTTYEVIKINSCYLRPEIKDGIGNDITEDKDNINNLLKKQQTLYDIKELIFKHSIYGNPSKKSEYLYYVEYRIKEDKSKEPFGTLVSDSIIRNGIIMSAIEKDKKNKKNEFINTTSIPEIKIKENFFKTKEDKAWKNIIYEPNENILEEWWNQKIYENFESKTKNNDSVLKFKFKSDGLRNPEFDINKSDIKEEWMRNKDAMNRNSNIEASIKKELNKTFNINPSVPEPHINITNDEWNDIFTLLKKMYNKKIKELANLRHVNKTIGGYQVTECKNIGIYIDNENVNNNCRYITEDLIKKLTYSGNIFSPTAKYCKNNILEKACVCYGSQIIPSGVKNKQPKNNNDIDIYPGTNIHENLSIEAEHIAHFLQMMFFAGSSYENWKNLINGSGVDASKFEEDFESIKEVRELLYDISIELYNQWKYNQNLIDFSVTIGDDDKIDIEAKYNNELMDKILCQTYLGKRYIDPDTREEWKLGSGVGTLTELPTATQKEQKHNLKDLSKTEPIKYVNGSNIDDIKDSDIEGIYEQNRDITHIEMENRIQKLNEIFKKINCETLLLITCTAFREMIIKLVTSNNASNTAAAPHYSQFKFLNYNFREKLSTKKTGGGSKEKSNAREIVEAYEKLYEPFNNFETIDHLKYLFINYFTNTKTDKLSIIPEVDTYKEKTSEEIVVNDLARKRTTMPYNLEAELKAEEKEEFNQPSKRFKGGKHTNKTKKKKLKKKKTKKKSFF